MYKPTLPVCDSLESKSCRSLFVHRPSGTSLTLSACGRFRLHILCHITHLPPRSTSLLSLPHTRLPIDLILNTTPHHHHDLPHQQHHLQHRPLPPSHGLRRPRRPTRNLIPRAQRVVRRRRPEQLHQQHPFPRSLPVRQRDCQAHPAPPHRR
jgi:hypothetical protein